MTTYTGTSTSSPVLITGVAAGTYVPVITSTDAGGSTVSAAGAPFTVAAPPSGGLVPNGGPTGITWSLKFDDEFTGTSLDTSKWNNADGGSMNGVTCHASNIQVTGGNCILTLASTSSGAEIYTDYPNSPAGSGRTPYGLPVGGYVEFYAYFPGPGSSPGTQVDNWSAVWTSGPNWAQAGEIDIAECGGNQINVNYHWDQPAGTHQQQGYGTPAGNWSNSWHTYGCYRTSSQALIYYDGTLVKTVTTHDNGQRQSIIANVGQSNNNTTTGSAGALRLGYVRAWEPA